MIFSILHQRGGMLVVLGGHLVNIGDGYWWFKLNLIIYTKIWFFFVTKERFNIFLSNRICLLIIVLHCMNAS